MVGEAGTAKEALALIPISDPDVVVLDLALPYESGLALLPKILAASPSTRVLMLSGYPVDPYASDALRAGATGFAEKDSEPVAVLRALRAAARGEITVPSFEIDAPERTPANAVDVVAYRRLTRREREVFILAACGFLNADAAARLGISEKTVETHRASLNRKLRIHSSADLARFAARNRVGSHKLAARPGDPTDSIATPAHGLGDAQPGASVALPVL